MSKFSFLNENQVFGDERLPIFDKYGVMAMITDYAMLEGGYVSNSVFDIEGKKERIGLWWVNKDISIFTKDNVGKFDRDITYGGLRLVTPFNKIKDEVTAERINSCNIKEVDYGSFPQTIFNKEIIKDELEKTDNSYTGYNPYMRRYNQYQEYMLNGERIINMPGFHSSFGLLSNGKRPNESGDWVKVEPITWMIDEKTNLAITKKLLLSGFPFNQRIIDEYLNIYFSKEIKQKKKVLK